MTQARHAAGSGRILAGPSALAARVAEGVLVIVLAWIAAQAAWFVVYGTDALDIRIESPPVASSAAAETAAAGAPAASGLFSVPDGQAAATPDIAPETRLDLTLRGVRSAADGAARGSAVIETPQRGQRSIAVGGEIAPGVRLAEVHDDHVIIERSGARESLFISDAAARRAREARPAPSGSAAFGEMISPLSGRPDPELAARLDREDWIEGLRLQPAMENGSMTGFQVREASAIEVLRAAGLRPGDIIMRLNGEPLSDADAAGRALRSLATADGVRLSVRRDGEEITLEAPLSQR
jgi:general secretion pathway protein C